MKIEDWAKEEKASVERFVTWWNRQVAKDKKTNDPLFPSEMSPGDWDEQFRSWQS